MNVESIGSYSIVIKKGYKKIENNNKTTITFWPGEYCTEIIMDYKWT